MLAFHRAAQAEHQYQQVGIRLHGGLYLLAQGRCGAGLGGRAVARFHYAWAGFLPGHSGDRRYAEGEAEEHTSCYF